MKGNSQQDLLLAPSAHCLIILAVQHWGTLLPLFENFSVPASLQPGCTNQTCSFQTFQKGVK